jgi:hypothetical protein
MSAQLCRGAGKLCPKSRAFSGHSRPKDGVASLAYGVQRLTAENATKEATLAAAADMLGLKRMCNE